MVRMHRAFGMFLEAQRSGKRSALDPMLAAECGLSAAGHRFVIENYVHLRIMHEVMQQARSSTNHRRGEHGTHGTNGSEEPEGYGSEERGEIPQGSEDLEGRQPT